MTLVQALKYLIAGAAIAYTVYQLFSADNRDERPPGPHQSYEPPRPPVRRHDDRPSGRHQSYYYEPPQPPVRQRDDRPPGRHQSYEPPQPPVRRHDDRPSNRQQSYEPPQPPVRRHDDRPLSRHQSYEPPQPPVCRHDDRPSNRQQSYEPPQSPVRRHDEWQHQQAIDSSQGNLTPVEAHTSLRARARREGDLMVQYKQQSQEAYKRHDHVSARALSNEAKRHELEMERLDAEASAAIFKENNQDRVVCEIDLHGLYVKEAIAYSQKAVADARQRGDSGIRLIVGQGNHSEGGISRLRPAIEEDMQMHGHSVRVDPRNLGVLLVQLDD